MFDINVHWCVVIVKIGIVCILTIILEPEPLYNYALVLVQFECTIELLLSPLQNFRGSKYVTSVKLGEVLFL